jgi:hypothetical protein
MQNLQTYKHWVPMQSGSVSFLALQLYLAAKLNRWPAGFVPGPRFFLYLKKKDWK